MRCMSDQTQLNIKKELPMRWQRELVKGETIYHSTLPNHVSKKFPEGKWVGQVRREDGRGKLIKYPIRAFGTPKEAVEYVKGLRPDEKGQVRIASKKSATVKDLYCYVTTHIQRKLAEQTKKAKLYRWNTYIAPDWEDAPLSQVSRRQVQEWVTSVEEAIEKNSDYAPPVSQWEKVRTDLHALFESQGVVAPELEDRKNPFADLEFTPLPLRKKTTIESQHFPALIRALTNLPELKLCTDWIAEMFSTGLLSGLRPGEIMALCEDQLDFKNGSILVDRAMRKYSKTLDPKTRRESGDIKLQAMHLPKGGTLADPRFRYVPMSDQLSEILQDVVKRKGKQIGEWNLLWPSATGEIRDQSHFKSAWKTLKDRLHEIALYAPIEGEVREEIPTQRGVKQNCYILQARRNEVIRLPNIFDSMIFRDSRNSFASYALEVGIDQSLRQRVLGHKSKGVTETHYTETTAVAFRDMKDRLSRGWTLEEPA